MHSIAPVRSSGGAATYFAKDNYYTAEENAEKGVWGGAGARDLGLEGMVDKDMFEAVLNGHLPGGEKVGQIEGRRAGLDLTFSMPKSASVMAYVAGDDRILGANMRAVEMAIEVTVNRQPFEIKLFILTFSYLFLLFLTPHCA